MRRIFHFIWPEKQAILQPVRQTEGSLWYRIGFWVPLGAFLVRFWFLQSYQETPFFEPIPGGNDRALYDGVARQIEQGAWFPSGVFEYMPLYPWLLGIWYQLAGESLYRVGMIGALMDSLTVYGIIRLSVGMGATRLAAAIVGGFYALYPLAIVYSLQTMANSLNAFLLIFFAIVLHEGFLKDEKQLVPLLKFLFLGLMGGVICLTFAGMFLILGIVWLVLGRGLWKQKIPLWIRCGLFGLGILLPIAPVTLHNWRAEGKWVPITAHGGFNFYMGNHPGATGYSTQIEDFRGDAGSLLVDARARAEKEMGRHLLAAEFSRYWMDLAWRSIRENPFRSVQLTLKKFLKFWNHREYDDMRLLPMLQLESQWFTAPFWPGFACISFLGGWGMVFAKRSWWLKGCFFAGMMGMVFFFITSRYRLALVPWMLVLGALGLTQWFRTRQSHAGVGGCIASALVIVVFLPWERSDFRALDRYNTAAYLVGAGQYSKALFHASEGLKIDPQSDSLYFVAGNALMGLHHPGDAIKVYGEAVKINPRNAAAYCNAASAWLELGNRDHAHQLVELSLKVDPENLVAQKLVKKIEQQETPQKMNP